MVGHGASIHEMQLPSPYMTNYGIWGFKYEGSGRFTRVGKV